jgi:hypothetical protein
MGRLVKSPFPPVLADAIANDQVVAFHPNR